MRAICSPTHFDSVENRISPSLFKGPNTSVSRLAVISLAEHWDLFRRHLQKPPRRLEFIGEIMVGRLQEIGKNYAASRTEITVEQAPEDWNPAHAEIPQKLSGGLANEIIRALVKHRAS